MSTLNIENAKKFGDLTAIAEAPDDAMLLIHDGNGVKKISAANLKADLKKLISVSNLGETIISAGELDTAYIEIPDTEGIFKTYPIFHRNNTCNKLWTGLWNKETITVPNINQYRLLQIMTRSDAASENVGTTILAMKHPEWGFIRGIGGYVSAAGNHILYSFACNISEDTLTWVNASDIYVNSNTKIEALSVVGIYGIM